MKQDDFREPVVLALLRLGGSARRADVMEEVQELVELGEEDRKHIASDEVMRWQKHVDFMIHKMRGDLVKPVRDSEIGVWELTEEGWDYAGFVQQHWG